MRVPPPHALRAAVLSFCFLSACSSREAPVGPPRVAPGGLPMPTEHWLDPGAEARHKAGRKAWIEELHAAAPGVDWRAIELANGRREMERRRALAPARSSSSWTEVGSKNQAGRMHCATLGPDGAGGRMLYAGSALGGLWRGNPDGSAWEPLGDNLYGGCHDLLALPAENAGEPDVLIAGTSRNEVWVTRDLGASWEAPSGIGGLAEVRDVALLGDGVPTALVLARHGNSVSLFASTDHGRTFQSRWSASVNWDSSMWVPRAGAAAANTVYLLHQGRLRRSTDGGQNFTLVSTINSSASGGRLRGSEAGAPTLYAALNVSGWRLYRSDDAGQSWTQTHTISDFWESMDVSLLDPQRVVYGGVEAWRSTDGGSSFTKLNGWGDYYGDPAHKLHADLPGIYCWPDPANPGVAEDWFFCTDGGLYRSDDQAHSVQNLSLSGLGVSQYYSTHTSSANPDFILAGAQDQGYQRGVFQNPGGPGPSTNFNQLISGDYGHLCSSNGSHDLVYSTYPGFILVQAGETNPQLLYPWVDFPPGVDHLWLPPVVADPLDQRAFFFLGDQLYRYLRNHGAYWDHTLHSTRTFTDGGASYLSALAIAPTNSDRVYAVNSKGRYYVSGDHGVNWQLAAADGPNSHYFYGNALAVNPTNEYEAFAGGSGYSNPGVYRTVNGGQTWLPEATGLPSTLVYDLAYAGDGSGDVYAATEIGAWRWNRDLSSWETVMESGTPLTVYWSVEAVPGSDAMRFGTYGRGIWDFELPPSTHGSWVSYGEGASNWNALTLASQTPPNIGEGLTLDVSGGGQAGLGYVLAGRIQGQLPLHDGVQLVDQVVRVFPFTMWPDGDGNLHLSLPNNPSLIGVPFYFQAVAPDWLPPQGYLLSNGLEATIGY